MASRGSVPGGHERDPESAAAVRGLPKTCLVGAGASGITTARSLAARGVPFDWFEKGDRVGGIWAFENESGLSSAYRQLHINVSRARIEFSDHPMSDSIAQYPHHTELARYFDDYVQRFELHRNLRLMTEVRRARIRDGIWEIELSSGKTCHYDALIVANGHHSAPRWPTPPPPGEFSGEQMHSHDYRDNTMLRGRDVLVVGLGNSACDIAVESSMAARNTYLSVRRGAHILPKTMWRWTYDQVPGLEYALGRGIGIGRFGFQLPWRLRQWWLGWGHRLSVGRMGLYGLPAPEHDFGATHPTISPRLLNRLSNGEVEPRPAIERLDGELVHFTDGSAARADLIIWCTGYGIGFPFLGPTLAPVSGQNEVEMYWNVFSPDVPGLAFVGLLQPAAGSTMQISEIQGKWVASYLSGEYALPSKAEMRRSIARQRQRDSRRLVASTRHTVQVEQFDFAWRLRRELRRGRRRARVA
ncbi:MAG TPA: NAD(P)-binding domain-containing protein [Solirubrobacterales bacterium]